MQLPVLVRHPLEELLRERLVPPGARLEDFDTPLGEPALSRPDSVFWQVFRNPVAVFVGGVAAVLLELAEPRVRTGVWEHTTFRDRPLERMRQTAWATMTTVYGPRSRAEALIAEVSRRHAHVTGTTPGGLAYRALDDDLLTWVHATALFGFLQATQHVVRPLAAGERDRFYLEGQTGARLYGVQAPPRNERAVELLFERMRPLLEPSEIVFEFLDIMLNVAVLPRFFRPQQRSLVKAGVSCLPSWTRERLGLDTPAWHLGARELRIVSAVARQADRLALDTHPAVRASRRMGLAPDALYRAPVVRAVG